MPIETAGGQGTACAHWDEVRFPDFGSGRNPELTPGFLDAPMSPSDTTIASFDDLGHVIAPYAAAVPVPPAGVLLLAGAVASGGLRRATSRPRGRRPVRIPLTRARAA